MSLEVCSYRLSMQGKPVGSQVMTFLQRGPSMFVETKVLLQGSFGSSSVKQSSKFHIERGSSNFFNEETQEGSNKRQFNVTFDYHKGLVRASRSAQDQAEIPLALPYSDPLSIMFQMRHFSLEKSYWNIPMLGKNVKIERVAEKEVSGPMGTKLCHVYKLWPGGSYVYVEKEHPHLIRSLTQRFDSRVVEAQLVKHGFEKPRPPQTEQNTHRRRSKKPYRKASQKTSRGQSRSRQSQNKS